MYSGTHVSINACLYRVDGKVNSQSELPANAVFLGYGRLVHPKGHYAYAPTVALYRADKKLIFIP